MGKPKVLVIGGGFAGCCAAHLLSQKGYEITLVESANYLGGGCKTFFHGGHPYTYGPRHFLTPKEHLFEFLHQYVPMRKIPEHEFLTYVERDPGFYHFPIHVDDIGLMPDKEKIYSELDQRKPASEAKNFEDFWIRAVGPTLYSKFIDGYSKKMWQIQTNEEFEEFEFSPKGAPLKTGPKAAWTEAISGFPLALNGYDDYFAIATRDTNVRLNTRIDEFDMEKKRVKIGGMWESYDLIVSTTSPEVILNNAFGPLRWVGRDFYKMVFPVKAVFPENVYFLYYANDEPFTRLVEYKKFYNGYDSDSTLVVMEKPSFKNKLYPYPTKKDQALAQKYFDVMPKDVYSIGRAGKYRYIDVDDIIEQCMNLAAEL